MLAQQRRAEAIEIDRRTCKYKHFQVEARYS